MGVKCLAQEHNTVPRPGLEPGPFDPESSALTMSMYLQYVPYYNAADQCIRLLPKMVSFAAENTQDNVFLLLRSKDTFMEFRIERNKSREYSTAEKSRH